jgi:hypothetical protein
MLAMCNYGEHLKFKYCAPLLHNLSLMQPQIGGGINEQQMHHETKDKKFYSSIDKKLYLLLLVKCQQKAWSKLIVR